MKVTEAPQDPLTLSVLEAFVGVISKRSPAQKHLDSICALSLSTRALRHDADADADGDAGADVEESEGETTWTDFSKGNHPFRTSAWHD